MKRLVTRGENKEKQEKGGGRKKRKNILVHQVIVAHKLEIHQQAAEFPIKEVNLMSHHLSSMREKHFKFVVVSFR